MRRTLAVVAATALAGGALAVAAPPVPAATLAPAPDRVITASTSLPSSLALSPSGLVYVSNEIGGTGGNGAVRVYAHSASGATQLHAYDTSDGLAYSDPRGFTLSSTGTRAWLGSTDNAVRAFALDPASGGLSPLPMEGIGSAGHIWGPVDLAADGAGNLYVASTLNDRVLVYASAAAGVPRTLSTAAPYGLTVRGSSVYVAGGGMAGYVKVFAAGATGATTATRTISGAATGLTSVSSVAVDRYGRIYAASYADDAVRVFAPDARGNVAPLTTIAGARTQIDAPRDLALDAAGNLWVANYTAPGKVLRFPALAPPPAPRPPARPTTAPSKPQALKVSGKATAKKRVVRWKAPARSGGLRVLRYRVVVKKGGKTLLVRTVGPATRKLVVKRAKLRKGRHTVRVRAINAKGGSPYAVRAFRVRR